jgi:hypothetical protein
VSSIETMITYALAVAHDDAHGYSQPNRTNAASPDMDCSRLVQLAVQAGGWPIGDGLFYTGNERARLEAIGWTWHPGTEGVRRGDILLRAGHHTAIALGDGTRVEAWIDEAGDIIGRQPGDQTGQEIRIHAPALDYPWDGYLRAPATAPSTAQTATPERTDMQIVTSTATKTQWLLTADGTLVGLPNPEYARVAQKMVSGTLQGINAREVDLLKDLARRVKEARK